MMESGFKEIFLSQVAKVGAQLLRHQQMIINYKPCACSLCNGKNRPTNPPNFFQRTSLCPQLNHIRASFAKLLGYLLRISPSQICHVQKCVEMAFCKRFHSSIFAVSYLDLLSLSIRSRL